MSKFKSGFVTIIGRPNVGKSTLMNYLIGSKIAITSNKPQTTRSRIKTVLTDEERFQMVFLDTPGFHKAKNKLGEYMVNVIKDSIVGVDVLVWIVEPDETIGKTDLNIARELWTVNIPVILVINKIDKVPRERLFVATDNFSKLSDFAEIVPLSAMKGTNCDELIDVIYKYLPEGPMYYDADTLTDQSMRQIVAEIIREKSLHALDEEVPHGIAVAIDKMKERSDKKLWDIDATIYCEKESHKGIIIGRKGSMLKKIGTNARYEIEHSLDMHVNLKLWVKVKKDWRSNAHELQNFGYFDE
ncbi:MAG: GTPase Era [Lachnospiraceae bacterium]|nr:GTPase Era [Lachnospiraceae bacterium]